MGKISWDYFKTSENENDGIRMKFEALCRQLFENEFLSENVINRTVHCNPNNPGVEADPILNKKSGKWISFQAKYFDSNVDYEQIKHSAEKIVEYYSGKLDIVYLFCNKPISIFATGYQRSVDILSNANITIELITDTAILDLVRKYPMLGLYYFQQHFLTKQWMDTHMQEIQKKLGERYNAAFNVDTVAEKQLSLFVQDKQAAAYFNDKKREITTELAGMRGKYEQYTSCLDKIYDTIKNISDVSMASLMNVLKWNEDILNNNQEEISFINDEIRILQNRYASIEKEIYSSKIETMEFCNKKDEQELFKVRNEMNYLMELAELLQKLQVSEEERKLLTSKILFVEGQAGVGKSHLFANKSASLLGANQYALLLLGGDYFDNSEIQLQIARNLQLQYSFQEFIDILELWGKENECKVPIFIDALNETWNCELWKSGLPSIIQKIEKMKYVRLAVSFRKEYKRSLIGEIQTDQIFTIEHRGFLDNSLDAVQQFMNYYGITFTPMHFFCSEITNPLFLTLYCKTYQDGNEVDFLSLYDRVLDKANGHIFVALKKHLEQQGYYAITDLTTPIIDCIADYILVSGKKQFTKSELIDLPVWNRLRVNANVVIQQLIYENIMHSFPYEEKEILYFSYDQMNDCFCAKTIFRKYKKEEDVRQYLIDEVLGIKNGNVTKHQNIGLFIACCAFFAEQYKSECIDIINMLNDDITKRDIFSNYVSSFQWRGEICISPEELFNECRRYTMPVNIVWEMFITNSVRCNSQYNAEGLYKILMSLPLNKRDRLWSIYVNRLTGRDENRLIQLIKMYDSGKKIEFSSKKERALLLELLCWCLASSDRWMRDVTSKAMVEILKDDFSLCKPLVEKFQPVNDPYIIQRLYGVMFGAATKRTDNCREEYKALAVFIYETIFNGGDVYPDILLRDYARLLIERFIYEFPDESGNFVYDKILPPYKSEDILDLKNQEYSERDFSGGMARIITSMKFEGMGMYGDFGRYVFQSAISNFDVNQEKVFNYAVYFILKELGYNEDLFGDYDCEVGRYDYNRHKVAKTERIGKKYQWIALHNILARISDNYAMINRFSFEQSPVSFEGAWDPFVRDFDPTLNYNTMVCPEAPRFPSVKEHMIKIKKQNAEAIPSNITEEKNWIDCSVSFFTYQKEDLLLNSDKSGQWIVLSKYADTGDETLAEDKLLSWNWIYGFFVTEKQRTILERCLDNNIDVFNEDLMWIPQSYRVFNREFPWSAGCISINQCADIEYEIPTGKTHHVSETIESIDFEKLDSFLKNYGENSEDNIEMHTNFDITNDKILLPMKEVTVTREIIDKEQIGEVMHTTVDLIWETGYDASNNQTISISLPCGKLIEEMQLKQILHDGYWCDETGEIVAFDTNLTHQNAGVVVRKDILDSFLSKTNLKLLWIVKGSNEVHGKNLHIVAESNWRGLWTYNNESIQGKIKKIRSQVYR